MSTASLSRETYLPDHDDAVAQLSSFMRSHDHVEPGLPEPRYVLSGVEPGDHVELPAEVYRVLRQVVDAMQQGHAVTVIPQAQRLTTQQAAELLGVSRPTVIKLLTEGKIPFEQVGSHRRILLKDLLEHREQRRAAQYAAIEATAVEPEDEDDMATMLERLRESRRVVARERRASPAS